MNEDFIILKINEELMDKFAEIWLGILAVILLYIFIKLFYIDPIKNIRKRKRRMKEMEETYY